MFMPGPAGYDWQSCSTGGEELLDPSRSQYLEAFAVVRCKYQGVTYSRCVLIWVTTDFAIARGWFQGYPKKLGSAYVTRPYNRGKATARIAPGGTFGASLAAYDHRLATAKVTLREPAASNGFVNAHKMVHNRYMPSLVPGAGFALNQIVTMGGIDLDLGQPWVGDAELTLFDSPWDEPASLLPVDEIIAGYFCEVGTTFNGGVLLTDNSQPI